MKRNRIGQLALMMVSTTALATTVIPAVAMADHCVFPNDPSIYTAPLANAFAGFLQSPLPKIQFDVSTIQLTHNSGEGGRDGITLKTVDGTLLDVRGSFVIVPRDKIDDEGNVIGCTLWLELNPSDEFDEIYITNVTNEKSGYDLLTALVLINSGNAYNINIDYPYNQ